MWPRFLRVLGWLLFAWYNTLYGTITQPKQMVTINKGQTHIVEPELDIAVASAVKKGYLKAGTTPVEANTYLIVVPTPFKDKNKPDISFVEAATKGVIPLLKKGDLYIIESTGQSIGLSKIGEIV